MPGTGDVVQVPKSRFLQKLLEWNDMSSLAERAFGWKAAAPAPSAGGEKRKAAQPSGAAKAKAKKSKNMSGVGFFPPSSAWRAAWYGDTFRSNGCQYDHVNGITYTAACRTRRRTRSASTVAADSAADPATAAAISTATPAAAAAAAAGGRGGRGSAAKHCQLQQDGWRW